MDLIDLEIFEKLLGRIKANILSEIAIEAIMLLVFAADLRTAFINPAAVVFQFFAGRLKFDIPNILIIHPNRYIFMEQKPNNIITVLIILRRIDFVIDVQAALSAAVAEDFIYFTRDKFFH